jgi:UDP-N-acetylglucosamine diphosphorylase / glucose-1-phosphate thymidylyltransferase / UDP-N-acetylgalactosamine diphosphorylase / glucosamine-1-phosphate N-acetyltransferase / galactosamine-1-phosphate N-acetyltransferase
MLAAPDLFDLTHFAHRSLFAGTTFAWEVLPHLEAYIRDQFATRLRPAVQTMLPPGAFIAGDVFIGTETVVEPGAPIRGPTIIGRACQIRQGAYIRGNVIVGDGCVVGHATEVKQSVPLNHAHAPHFAFIFPQEFMH